MESLEAILKMNSKHPPGRRSRCITDLCARVEALEKENKALRDASENAHQPAPAPQDGPPEQVACHSAPDTAEARSDALSVSSIRAIAARGDPVTAEQVLALCARVGALEAALRPFAEQDYSSVDALLIARRLLALPDFPPIEETFAALREAIGSHFDGVDPMAYVAELRGDDEMDDPLSALLVAARAWAGAIERQNVGEIERCEAELIAAVARCSP